MSRVKRGSTKRQRHKKILSLAKGAQGSRSVLFRTANQQVMHSLKYGYTHRALKKRIYNASTTHLLRIKNASKTYPKRI